MAETGQDAEVYGGDDPAIDVVLLDRAGDPLDVTGCSLRWGMAPVGVTTATIIKSTDAGEITIIEEDDGEIIARIQLTTSDTANAPACEFRHELKLTDADGHVETLMTGRLTIHTSVLD